MINYSIFDIEGDGLNPTKIHCLSVLYQDIEGEWVVKSTTSYDDMRKYFLKEDQCIIGHTIHPFDIPVVERILGLKIPKSTRIIDTLGISWYLYEERKSHGLESWGETFGIQKPPIDDWENLPVEDYIHRCEEDCKINHQLWLKQYSELLELYGSETEVLRICKYLSGKLWQSMLMRKKTSKWVLDVEKTTENLKILTEQYFQKIEELNAAMPMRKVMRWVSRPATMYKKDGSPTVAGQGWLDMLKEKGLPEDYSEKIHKLSKEIPPNAGSEKQVKEWLVSLGWKPKLFETKKDPKTGKTRDIPKISDSQKKLCSSVMKLADKDPGIILLEGLGVLKHRIGLLKGFLRDRDDKDRIATEIVGFANTLRMKHGKVVNLPKVNVPYGKYIRPCLTAPDGYELCDCDLASLENSTRNNFIYELDPDYVHTMMDPNFDSHLDLAVTAKMITQDDLDFFLDLKKKKKEAEEKNEQIEISEEDSKRYSSISKTRDKAKTTNYSALYGVGAVKLAAELQIKESEAKALLDGFKKRNWAVTAFAKSCTTKPCLGKKWVFNPLSRFWYTLRSDKDVFSVVNQSAGDYFFNLWLTCILEERPQLTGQYHDSCVLMVKEGHREEVQALLKKAIDRVNRALKLSLPIGSDSKFGKNYGFED